MQQFKAVRQDAPRSQAQQVQLLFEELLRRVTLPAQTDLGVGRQSLGHTDRGQGVLRVLLTSSEILAHMEGRRTQKHTPTE